MSLLNKIRMKSSTGTPAEELVKTTTLNESNLNVEEITFLLTSIKDLTFKVGDVELVYNTIIKLQSQYIDLNGEK
jgi:hypothetical protein